MLLALAAALQPPRKSVELPPLPRVGLLPLLEGESAFREEWERQFAAWHNELRRRVAIAIGELAEEYGANPVELAKVGWHLVELKPAPSRGRPKADPWRILALVAWEEGRLRRGGQRPNPKLVAGLAGADLATVRRLKNDYPREWELFQSGVRMSLDPRPFFEPSTGRTTKKK